MTLGDLDLQFSGKFRNSCPNSFEKTVALHGLVKANYWEQKTYSLFQSNTEESVGPQGNMTCRSTGTISCGDYKSTHPIIFEDCCDI